MARIADSLYKFLLSPVERNFYMLVALLFLFTGISLYSVQEPFAVKMKVFLHSFLLAYVCTYIAAIIKNRFIRGTYLALLFLTSALTFLTDCFCVLLYDSRFNVEFAEIILSINYKEVEEYISFYASPGLVAILLLLLLLVVGLVFLARRLPPIKSKVVNFSFILLLFASIFVAIKNDGVWREIYLGKLLLFREVKPIPDLREHLTHPEMNVNKEKHPANVVIIIGESFSRRNSSLYGYEKETNPLLGSYASKPNMVLFSNIKSPALSTISNFKCILSVYRSGSFHGTEWHLCPSMPEIADILGYNTYWVSNQSKSGLYDNLVTRYAELCNEEYFTNHENVGKHHNSYDEEVLPLIDKIKQQSVSDEKNFYFVHLMGSHYEFDKRYPEGYSRFKAADYLSFPENQRENRACYDNSILYNDYVVSEIIKKFEEEEVLVFYLSDHAIDLYCSSGSYVGHGKYTNDISSKYGREIPFMIFMSDSYMAKFPDEVARIRKYHDRVFSTNDFVFSVMDILGTTFRTGHDVQRYSLFSNNYPK